MFLRLCATLALIATFSIEIGTVSISYEIGPEKDDFIAFKIQFSKTYKSKEEEQFRMMIFIDNQKEGIEVHKHSDKLSHEILGEELNSEDLDFEEFKKTYNKTYKTKESHHFRQKIFQENKKKIEEHNLRFAKNLETYEMSVNQFTDMLYSEIKSTILGAKLSDQEPNGTATFIPPMNFNYSDEMDWRQHGAVTGVKNQGPCGSCWSFAATGALEGQHFRKTGKLVSLSEQNLVDCTGAYGCNGCSGGQTNQAFNYIKDNYGIDFESSYPYQAVQSNCRFDRSKVAATDVGYALLKQGSETDLQKAVASIGPIAIYIDASQALMNYRSGVFYDSQCNPNNLNHAVLAVGYGTDSRGGDYWLVKNSWSSSWGESGYIKMARNRNNNCGIGMFSVYPLV